MTEISATVTEKPTGLALARIKFAQLESRKDPESAETTLRAMYGALRQAKADITELDPSRGFSAQEMQQRLDNAMEGNRYRRDLILEAREAFSRLVQLEEPHAALENLTLIRYNLGRAGVDASKLDPTQTVSAAVMERTLWDAYEGNEDVRNFLIEANRGVTAELTWRPDPPAPPVPSLPVAMPPKVGNNIHPKLPPPPSREARAARAAVDDAQEIFRCLSMFQSPADACDHAASAQRKLEEAMRGASHLTPAQEAQVVNIRKQLGPAVQENLDIMDFLEKANRGKGRKLVWNPSTPSRKPTNG